MANTENNQAQAASGETVTVIDLTPTWTDILPLMILSVKNTPIARGGDIIKEFERMAEAADKWNAHCKQAQA